MHFFRIPGLDMVLTGQNYNILEIIFKHKIAGSHTICIKLTFWTWSVCTTWARFINKVSFWGTEWAGFTKGLQQCLPQKGVDKVGDFLTSLPLWEFLFHSAKLGTKLYIWQHSQIYQNWPYNFYSGIVHLDQIRELLMWKQVWPE